MDPLLHPTCRRDGNVSRQARRENSRMNRSEDSLGLAGSRLFFSLNHSVLGLRLKVLGLGLGVYMVYGVGSWTVSVRIEDPESTDIVDACLLRLQHVGALS